MQRSRFTRHLGAASTAVMVSIITMQAHAASAPAGPIKDSQGRISYIVDLKDDATAGVSMSGLAAADGFPTWHKPAMRVVAKSMGDQFGFKATHLTSHLGNSFTAFLTPAQFAQLKKDGRVRRVTQDAYLSVSGGWSDSAANGETVSWGLKAVGGGKPVAAPKQSPVVYLLDLGAANHIDLPDDMVRVNAINSQYPGTARISAVGCWPHATATAGVIGAKASNWTGVIGVVPGVKIHSIAVGDTNNAVTGADCSNGLSTSDIAVNGQLISGGAVAAALDYVYQQVATAGRGVGIVNMSINYPGTDNNNPFSISSVIGEKMARLATPATGYPGAFIVQSAGNQQDEVALHAYNIGKTATWPQTYLPARKDDGIMVVGGVTEYGEQAKIQNGGFDYSNLAPATSGWVEPGSNYGTGIDAWAPARHIQTLWTAWNPWNDPAIYPDSHTVYTNVQSLSGTSFAAPFVAGVAAYLMETDASLTTPAAVELAVRKRMMQIGTSAQTPWGAVIAQDISMPNLNWVRLDNGSTKVSSTSRAAFRRHPANAKGYLVFNKDGYIRYATFDTAGNFEGVKPDLLGPSSIPVALAGFPPTSELMMIGNFGGNLAYGTFGTDGRFANNWTPLGAGTSSLQVNMVWVPAPLNQMVIVKRGDGPNATNLYWGTLNANRQFSGWTQIFGLTSVRAPTVAYHPRTGEVYIVAVDKTSNDDTPASLKLARYAVGTGTINFVRTEALPGAATNSPVAFAWAEAGDASRLYLVARSQKTPGSVNESQDQLLLGAFNAAGTFESSNNWLTLDGVSTTGPVAASEGNHIRLITTDLSGDVFSRTYP